MAKPIDNTKIERIRDAAIAIISRHGIQNCSVAAIAKEAGVSVGYLYRHYAGKTELINDMLELYFNLINEKIAALIADNRNIEYVVEGVVRHILITSEENTQKSRFLIMLLNDFSIDINERLKQRIGNLAEELISMLRSSDTVDRSLGVDDLYFAMIGVPMQFLSQRFSSIMPSHNGMEEIVAIALKVLQPLKR